MCLLQNVKGFDVQLVAAGMTLRALILTDAAGNDDRGFLRDLVGAVKLFLWQVRLKSDAVQDA